MMLNFEKFKKGDKKISMVTCYDHWTARILADTDIDILLVGDSLSMVVHGFDSTVHATEDMMALHAAAVARAKTGKPIVVDLPFLSHRKGKKHLMKTVDLLMKAGADAVKIETPPGEEKIIKYVVNSGVPVVGHIGLTPQYVHQLGGYKVQGREEAQALALKQSAQKLTDLGCRALVLECVPSLLAKKITEGISIPTIGIGAGPDCDGQVLVIQDLLGLNPGFKPKFVRHFANGEAWMREALGNYIVSVHARQFPSEQESFQ
ncbi:MAG: 3-methyl-2-oxobutanoate hydroxymethyltransferase [Bdellovibrionales bacterium]|nr:3-methyl-2-oxobutanoate hydroxymethyltransferase [Bdellovibrionales bacterium]